MSIRSISEGKVTPPAIPSAPAPVEAPARATGEASPFAQVLHGLGREAQRGETMMKKTLEMTQAGRDLGPSELIALQAGVYRYSEAIDLAAKLVDRASTGVKTIVTGQ
jgi:hypothetical protein